MGSSAMQELNQQAEQGQQHRLQQVASLLGRKHNRIDPVQALPLLPPQVDQTPLLLIGTVLYTLQSARYWEDFNADMTWGKEVVPSDCAVRPFLYNQAY